MNFTAVRQALYSRSGNMRPVYYRQSVTGLFSVPDFIYFSLL
ncbi:hypothetical protein CLOSTHATH_05558 [Hungatella hathewayi DSM 13479]|uniref:Uncharacterized protein n=1 Tax=Hungatella hathewayi DSM 13479 TaxID=566550 RepID=D3APK6_9FIRM|nr:hypothetical protein CLOSTHATH_05558 [Hungatella hathewayi DSM 13479]